MKAEDVTGLLFNLILVGIVFYVVVRQIKKARKRELEFKEWVEGKGYSYIGSIPDEGLGGLFGMAGRNERATTSLVQPPSSLDRSSFNAGRVDRGLIGFLPVVKNQFYILNQTETRGSGKNRKTYARTIVGIDVPDTQFQLIVNSKINNDIASGGNLIHYDGAQRQRLESDFGTYFDVYMPAATQSEALTLLAPDTMQLILTEFADYDIEINGSSLFLYIYKHIDRHEIELLIPKLESLLEEMRLRLDDTRREKATSAPVARTAVDADMAHRPLKKNKMPLLLVLITMLLFAIPILAIMGIPIRYISPDLGEKSDGIAVLVPFLLVIICFVITGLLIAVLSWKALSSARLRRQYERAVQRGRDLL